MSLYEKFASVCRSHREKIALQLSDSPDLTYGDLQQLAQRHAAAMHARGLQPGDRIIVQIEKSVDGVALYLACLQTGVILIPLNTAYTLTEVQYFLKDAKPKVYLHEDQHSPEWAPPGVECVAIDLWSEEVSTQDPYSAVMPRAGSDVAAICYTSGTTGRSKGAMITHDNMGSNVEALHAIWQFSPEDVLLHILPIFHVHGLFVALNCALFIGATVKFELGFDVERVCRLLPDSSVMMGVPTHYTRLLSHDGFTQDVAAHMRLFLSGSAPLHADTHKAFEARTGQRILERYGMTEAGMILSNPYDGDRVAGTVGYPLPKVTVRIRASDGGLEEGGGVGVLEVRGPNVFAGYWQQPEKTRETFTHDGWLITGDLVTRDAGGRITIVGREKDLIISGGYNIYPKEIEQVLDDHPSIVESAVFGIPHPDFGESIVAAVVLHKGKSFDEDDMQACVDGTLARFKQPHFLQCLDALPRNAMGKVQKAQLRDAF